MNISETPNLNYVEGTDGVGKDVIGGLLALRKRSSTSKFFLHPGNPWDADKIDLIPANHPLMPACLIKAIIWDLLRDKPKQNQIQISLAGPRSAAWQLAAQEPLAPLFIELLQYCPAFDSAILLQASLEAKRSRIKARAERTGQGISAIDQLVFTNPRFVADLDFHLEEIMRHQFGATVIDTTDLTISQVEQQALAATLDCLSGGYSDDHSSKMNALRSRLGFIQEELMRYVAEVAHRDLSPEATSVFMGLFKMVELQEG